MIDVVLLGFGGPEASAEIRPFLDRVLAGRRIPQARYEEVAGHYEHLGGRSPFNELTRAQARALETELQRRGVAARVCVAFRHAAPFIDDVARELQNNGTDVVAVILAAHQSAAGWDKYGQAIERAAYLLPFYEHPLFVQAHSMRIRDALSSLHKADLDDVELIFTAHSIPQAMADNGPYTAQLARSADLIAQQLGSTRYTLAFQSRSGSPNEAWLEPDVRDVLAALPGKGISEAVVAPIGFLCDHVEVLYDLDVEAAEIARRSGVRMARAASLNDHPLFIRMLADLVQQCGV
ncbi:MAG TPA: ferrochelatase [Candidatus Baltobacteraceae bacterium]|jgi:ferrochelatase|nr:ferrochelatase [Candidatus Baltobacteraceae bacterium]